MSDGFSPSQIEAAEQFGQAAHSILRSANVATVIAGASRMAGTFMFRSFNFQPDTARPGDAVLSVEANEKGPQLMNVLGNVLTHIGIVVSESFVESTAEDDQPKYNFLDTEKLLEPEFEKIKKQYELSYSDAAYAVAAAVAFLIKEYGDLIDNDIAFGIAVYGFIEGTKTLPQPLSS
jgi:hypothetical protein